MTQQEFLTYVQQGTNTSQVNIWYSDDNTYTIQGITVPILSGGVDSLGNPLQSVNLTSFLNQVQQLVVPLSTPQGTVDITLTVTTAQVYPSFYFFLVTPLQVGQIVATVFTGPSAVVGFSPTYNTVLFNQSPYNVLGGTVITGRESAYTMISDRYKVGTPTLPGYTGPTNIDELISGSATKASVQDSNYDNTGWNNARYDGSRQITNTFRSPSATSGRIFKAALYPLSGIDTLRYQASSSLVIYSDYFYSGFGDIPGFDAPPVPQYSITAPPAGQSYTEYGDRIYISSTTIGTNIEPFLPRPGSVLAIDGTNNTIQIQSNFEQIKVLEVSLFSTTPFNRYLLQVLRRYTGTTVGAITNPIIPAAGDRFFTVKNSLISQVQGNKVVGINPGLLLVEETGQILTLGTGGYVVGATT